MQGRKTDSKSETEKQALAFQDVFYGRNAHFLPCAWNNEESLGRALVDDAGITGNTDDTVFRLAIFMIKEYLETYLKYEDNQVSDESFKNFVNTIINKYTLVLLGRDYSYRRDTQ
ncbi:hypothetical protein VQ643_00315 [Pseudomonas sp. F1_0610]|uniref:hypothetical protein n=1 Tax=Pseudomonas sp. F1_0610 TaxID=3114284 RepID=UPI0039C06BC4